MHEKKFMFVYSLIIITYSLLYIHIRHHTSELPLIWYKLHRITLNFQNCMSCFGSLFSVIIQMYTRVYKDELNQYRLIVSDAYLFDLNETFLLKSSFPYC